MNDLSPGRLALLTAFLVSLLATVLLWVAALWTILEVNYQSLVIAATLIFGTSWVIFYLVLKSYIYDKIKLIFRNMRLQKKDQNFKLNMHSDVLTDVNKQVTNWADDRMAEIRDLREKENFRKEFVGNVAHELKTPIFSIQGYILTLLEGAIDDPKFNKKFLKKAAKSAERMALLVEDLDTITQFESGNLKLIPERIDIVELAREVIESRDGAAEQKQIRVHFNKAYDRPIFVIADSFRISQVLTNLITNSINYGFEKGETILSMYDLGEQILIEVEDNGPGISKKHHPRLFERFYRVDKSRSRHEGGTGLGLAICKHIVEAHQQSISVRSKEGEGSLFSFTLLKA